MRTAFLMSVIASLGGFYSVAQPGSSVMFYMQCFVRLAVLGSVLVRFCACSFGAPFKKPHQWLTNKPWLLQLSGPCNCGKGSRHFIVEGTFTAARVAEFSKLCRPTPEAVFGRTPRVGESVSAFSAMYPLSLVRRMASGSLQSKLGQVPVLPLSARHATLNTLTLGGLGPLPPCDPSEGLKPEPRPFYEDPEWVGELADSLEFKELLRYRFGGENHINILETRSYKTWLKWCSTRHPNSRLLGLIDSRVLLGAASKGRSSSPALCHILQSALPYVLGSGLYPGGLHVYSAHNRSDGPSRNTSVAPPTKERPLWLEALAKGDTYLFDLCLAASHVPRVAGRWLRLLLLVAGDIERNPGPSSRLRPRGPLDLESGFATSTKHKMRKALEAFVVWLETEMCLQFAAVMSASQSAALALRAYGLHLYSAGYPRYLYVYAITAVQDLHPQHRNQLTPAWQVDKKWQAAEPGECRPVISQPIVQAAVTLALCWGWNDWACLTLIGFLCMLHPAEMIPLTRRDLVLPSDAMSTDMLAYVHLRNPKTQRFARRQHCRLEDPLTLRFLISQYEHLPLDAKLFRGSMHMYRTQWNAIMQRLGVPHTLSQKGATPGVLRGSGATFLYLETEDISLVAWRGRWAKIKTVEFYLQEVGAQLLLQELPRWARDRISVLRRYARPLLLLSIASNQVGQAQGP